MTPRGFITVRALLPLLAASGVLACYSLRPSGGGGQTTAPPARRLMTRDVAVPSGYQIDVVAQGLTFPTGVAFDADGRLHVVESGYSYGETWTTPRLLRVATDGSRSVVAEGDRNGPWNGVAFHDGAFFVAEGGVMEGGRILRIDGKGKVTTLVKDLPSFGDHHTNGPAVGGDGWIYFGQGTATNSAVVGRDSAKFGWLARHPEFHDVPCEDVTLAGTNYEEHAPHPSGGRVRTGAFSAFGTPTTAGQVVRGRVPCSGAVMRVKPEGGDVDLVAWGFRNPFGLAFAPDGTLYVTDNSYDERGSRPVWGTGDLLWAVRRGAWYGWPDFWAERPLTDGAFEPPVESGVKAVLATKPGTPSKPAAIFAVHSSSSGADFSRKAGFGFIGDAFVAQFGDMAPSVGKVLHPVGFKVVRVDMKTGVVHDFAVNRGKTNGPASAIGTAGFERPVSVRFDPSGDALYVVDFGVMTVSAAGARSRPGTGVLWRIRRAGA